jgi:hypothetical protein
MVDRALWDDLLFLAEMKPGGQRERTPTAQALSAAGLVTNAGIDGGILGDLDSGGVMYEINQYGHALMKHGLAKMR